MRVRAASERDLGIVLFTPHDGPAGRVFQAFDSDLAEMTYEDGRVLVWVSGESREADADSFPGVVVKGERVVFEEARISVSRSAWLRYLEEGPEQVIARWHEMGGHDEPV